MTALVLSDETWNHVATHVAIHQRDQLQANSHVPAAEIYKRLRLRERFQEPCYRSHIRIDHGWIVAPCAGGTKAVLTATPKCFPVDVSERLPRYQQTQSSIKLAPFTCSQPARCTRKVLPSECGEHRTNGLGRLGYKLQAHNQPRMLQECDSLNCT